MAMGMASDCPFVISARTSAQVREQNNMKPIVTKHEMRLFIGLEPKYEVSFKKRRVRRIRQGRCTIHRIFDRLAGGGVAIALGHACSRYLPTRKLSDFDQTIKADGRRGRLDPHTLDPMAEFRDIAIAQWAGFDGASVLLVSQLLAEFVLAVLPSTVVGRPLGLGDLLGFSSLLGLRGLFSVRGSFSVDE